MRYKVEAYLESFLDLKNTVTWLERKGFHTIMVKESLGILEKKGSSSEMQK